MAPTLLLDLHKKYGDFLSFVSEKLSFPENKNSNRKKRRDYLKILLFRAVPNQYYVTFKYIDLLAHSVRFYFFNSITNI